MELEEDCFLVGFHQQVQRERQHDWHDWHIKLRTFKVDAFVLLYDKKFKNFQENFKCTSWGHMLLRSSWMVVQFSSRSLMGNHSSEK